MSTPLARSPRSPAGSAPAPTRQQLDELDALLQRMLDLPVNQAAEVRARLSSAGVPVHGYTVISNRSTGCNSTNQTTGTSYVGTNAEKYTGTTIVGDKLDPTLCLAGHATETNPATPVMRASFDVLYQLTRGGVSAGESAVDPNIN